MNDETSAERIRSEPWFANAPEWLGEVIVRITKTSQDASGLMIQAGKIMQELNAREERVSSREDLLAEKQQSFINAIADLTDFASRIYGPDSAFANVNRKLDQISLSIQSYTATDERRHEAIEKRFVTMEERVTVLEKLLAKYQEKLATE